ncbi:MAG: sensor histidine kinase KdpD [Hungatella sp.]|nr:sensor histidine kinase KdpD [Hungatella sp.]
MLKIFFGYADGAGKTRAMLWAACQAKEQGMDVVAGYMEPRLSSQALGLLEGLEQLPALELRQGDRVIREFHLDAALSRKPQLILIDGLAHKNSQGCRHTRRYQDVQELLKAGIHVYTTVNVQDIESLNDVIADITGQQVRERIPDSVFDHADQVEMVDIEPEELLERLGPGRGAGSEGAGGGSCACTQEVLTVLRRLALRRLADRLERLTGSARSGNGGYHADEHILVCLSSSPSNAKTIRTAARMAGAFGGNLTALFVETPDFPAMEEADRKRLRDNMGLARQLGARIETTHGEDVPFQIAEFARLSDVSKIVIGRSTVSRKGILDRQTLTERLIKNAPGLDIHIIPDTEAESSYQRPKKKLSQILAVSLWDGVKSVLVLLGATLVGSLFFSLGFTEANIINVYILGVLIVSVITSNRLCSLAVSVVGVLVFNFFFTIPRFTFYFHDPSYPVTFGVMFAASFLTGSLAARLKDNARQSAKAAFRTKILFETNQLLQKEKDAWSVTGAAAGQLLKLLKRDIVMYLSEDTGLSEPRVYSEGVQKGRELTWEQEKAAAEWVFKNNRLAGAGTDTLSDRQCLYLAIRVNQRVYGVTGIFMGDKGLDSFENSVVLSILGECALALENIKNAKEKEEAAILAKNEQLRANLLRAISHDLRTPLTSISGNASYLLSDYEKLDHESRRQMFGDIYDDAVWLINLVENLLAVTRIEEGRMNLNQSAELMDEVISEALCHVDRRSRDHVIQALSGEDFIFARIDAKLIVQVIINIVDNAVKYTPAGSLIQIRAERKNGMVEVAISDNGPGIPDDQKEKVFDMFYSGANKVADSRRSLGLGLSLCRSIVNAHGGSIFVSDNQPKGAVFTFTLPLGEVELHE